MIEPTIHLISGLPRSVSTLLANILAQNPRLHATATNREIPATRLPTGPTS